MEKDRATQNTKQKKKQFNTHATYILMEPSGCGTSSLVTLTVVDMLREIWGAEGISIGKKELFGKIILK
jgi:hypothetical protein